MAAVAGGQKRRKEMRAEDLLQGTGYRVRS